LESIKKQVIQLVSKFYKIASINVDFKKSFILKIYTCTYVHNYQILRKYNDGDAGNGLKRSMTPKY